VPPEPVHPCPPGARPSRDGDHDGAPEAGPAEPAPTRAARRVAVTVLGTAAVVALYLWDDALLAAPVIAMTGLAGAGAAIAVLGPLYALGSFGLAMLAVRAYNRQAAGHPSRLAARLSAHHVTRRSGLARRLLDSGRVLGFVAASFLLGAILTTWLVRYAGRREGIERVALLSSLVFGLGFTAFYTGIAEAVFSL